MKKIHVFYFLSIFCCLCDQNVWSVPVGVWINCMYGGYFEVGRVTEGYEGDIERIRNPLASGGILELQQYLHPNYGSFLTLDYIPGGEVATIRTMKPLDADVLTAGIFRYSIICGNTGKQNNRTLLVSDINDNPPKFVEKEYRVTLHESYPLDSAVLTVRAWDADATTVNNVVTYSIKPPAPNEFEMLVDGTIGLRSPLNYNTVRLYNFTVVAEDVGGLSDTTTVIIEVEDSDNLNPYFDHSLYKASIPENQTGPLPTVTPEAIKAQDGDKGINQSVVYSIAGVIPSEYLSSFGIDQNSGIISVTTALDREEISEIALDIKAVQSDDGTKSAKAVVLVTPLDVNDNAPVFSSNNYTTLILAKDASVGHLVLTVSATDKDIGTNALITYSFLTASPVFDVDGKTGDITFASDLTELLEDTLLQVTVKAEDHGTPPQSSTATVLIEIKMSVTFETKTYNFTVKENQPKGTEVGKVKASPGSPEVTVNYTLITDTDLFAVDAAGTIRSLASFDKEIQERYIFTVEATDSRIPPNTDLTTVTVQVENVNEAPFFVTVVYQATIFNISPPKFPVVQVKATDPDVGESSELEYSLVEPSSLFDVEPSTGQVYVLSVEGQSGQVAIEVKATDKHGLFDTTRVEVAVEPAAESNVVVICLNQPINIVEMKIPEMEESLSKSLGWNVTVVAYTENKEAGREIDSLKSKTMNKTCVSLIAKDDNNIVLSADDVKSKLQTEEEVVKAGLQEVFGPELDFTIEEHGATDFSQPVIIVICVMVMLVIIAGGLFFIRWNENRRRGSKENFTDFSDAWKATETEDDRRGSKENFTDFRDTQTATGTEDDRRGSKENFTDFRDTRTATETEDDRRGSKENFTDFRDTRTAVDAEDGRRSSKENFTEFRDKQQAPTRGSSTAPLITAANSQRLKNQCDESFAFYCVPHGRVCFPVGRHSLPEKRETQNIHTED